MFLRKEKNGYHNIYYLNPETSKRTKLSTGTKNSVKAIQVFTEFKRNIEELKTGKIKPITISEFADRYGKHKSLYRNKGYANTIISLIKDLDRFLDYKIRLCELRPEHTQDYISELMTKYKMGTVKQKRMMIQNAIDYAKENRYLRETFTFKKIKLTITQSEKKYLSKESITKLLAKCEDQDLHDMIMVAFMTGMRKQELTTLIWDQVYMEKRIISLNNTNHITKSKKIRVIPLSDNVITVLKNRYLKKANEYVFTYKSKKWTGHLFYLYKMLVRSVFGKNTDVSFHTLRHSFASHLALQGIPIYTISKLLGHSNITTTQIYAHLQTNNMQDIVKGLNIEIVETN